MQSNNRYSWRMILTSHISCLQCTHTYDRNAETTTRSVLNMKSGFQYWQRIRRSVSWNANNSSINVPTEEFDDGSGENTKEKNLLCNFIDSTLCDRNQTCCFGKRMNIRVRSNRVHCTWLTFQTIRCVVAFDKQFSIAWELTNQIERSRNVNSLRFIIFFSLVLLNQQNECKCFVHM